jgi:hypothetical protein
MKHHNIIGGLAIATIIGMAIGNHPAHATTAVPDCDPNIQSTKTVVKAVTLASAKVVNRFNTSACGAEAINQLCWPSGSVNEFFQTPDDGASWCATPGASFNIPQWVGLQSALNGGAPGTYESIYTPTNAAGIDYNVGLPEVGGWGWLCIGYTSVLPQAFILNYSLGDNCWNPNRNWGVQAGQLQNQGDGAGFCITAMTTTNDGIMHRWELDATVDDSGLVDATTGLPLRGDHITLADDVWTDSEDFDAQYNPCK